MITKKMAYTALVMLVLIASMSIISATDTSDNDTQLTIEQTGTSINDNIQSDITQKQEKTINKSIQTKTKNEAQSVNNYEDLHRLLTENEDETLSVSLNGEDTYTITQKITLNNAIKSLNIQGNGRIIDGDNKYPFLDINHYCNLTINNLTIQNCLSSSNTQNKGSITISNTSTTSILNSKFLSNNGGNAAVFIQNVADNLLVENTTFDSNYAQYNSGAINIESSGNVTIKNSIFTNNYGPTAGALSFKGKINSTLNITSSNFSNNGGSREIVDSETGDSAYITSNTGAILIDTNGNASIINTEIVNNTGGNHGALQYIGRHNTITLRETRTVYKPGYMGQETYHYFIGEHIFTNLTIKDTNFTSNKGTNNTALSISNGNVTLDHVDFTNNTLQKVDNRFEGEGLVIKSNSPLYINNSNFDKNGLPENIDASSDMMSIFASVIYQSMNSMIIDNSNFTSNTGALMGDVIIYDNGHVVTTTLYTPIHYVMENEQIPLILINNTQIKYNKNILNDYSSMNGIPMEIPEKAPGITSYTNLIVDNTQFISNIVDNQLKERNMGGKKGVIHFHEDFSEINETEITHSCNVTNSVFKNNNPSYFVPEDGYINLRPLQYDFMYDGFMPDYANVSLYYNNETEEKQARLELEYEPIGDGPSEPSKIKVDSQYTETDIVLKMIINQTEESYYSQLQHFYNNTFYVTIPHDYIFSLDVTSPVEIEDNTTISGRAYFITSNGEEINLTQGEVKLYVNGTYIASTQIDENQGYEFNYTTNSLGTQNVTVIMNNSEISLILSNTTTFDVKIQTKITIEADNTTINKNTLITGNLTDKNDKLLPNTNITVYINNEKHDIKTDEHGEFSIPYTPTSVGTNYILALYPGNKTHIDSINTATFESDKINTTTTATITNQEAGNISFNTTVTVDENTITNGTIIVYDENGKALAVNTITSSETIITVTNLTGGKHTLYITYTGNDTHNPSNTTKTITVKPEAQIKIEILNDTEGNVKAEITVTDETGNPLPEQTVTVTLPDGTTSNMTTDKDGKIRVTDTTTQAGNTKITAEIPENSDVEATKAEKTFTIEPDYQKIIDKLTTQIEELENALENNITEINKLEEENQELKNNITQAQNEIKNLKQNLTEAQNIISNLTGQLEDAQEEIKALNNSVNKLEKQIKQLEDIIDTHNKTSKITAVPENATVDNNKVVVTLENKLGTPITNAPVTVKNSKGETIGTGKTDKDGVAVIPVDTKAGTENITITYPGSDKLTPASTTIQVTTTKNKVTVIVDPVTGIIGENIILKAHITDTNGNPVNGGNLVFKLNGRTLQTDGRFDTSTDKPMKFKVTNGEVTFTMTADLYLRVGKNITASYSGSYKYESAKGNVAEANIGKRTAEVTVTSPRLVKQDKDVVFTAKISDVTRDSSKSLVNSDDAYVIFKFNGKTLKDSKGEIIKVPVVNATAKYTYHVPRGTSGMIDGHMRDYMVTAVYSNNDFYPDARGTVAYNVERSKTTINITSATVKNDQLSIKADILDQYGKNVIGKNSISVKINGKTFKIDGKSSTIKVTDGKISLSGIKLGGNNVKSLTIITGERQSYYESQVTTKSVKTL